MQAEVLTADRRGSPIGVGTDLGEYLLDSFHIGDNHTDCFQVDLFAYQVRSAFDQKASSSNMIQLLIAASMGFVPHFIAFPTPEPATHFSVWKPLAQH